MTVTINGTTGIAGVDGSAATPAVQGGDANTGVFYGTDIVAISTGGTERMRVNASGHVGIGTTANYRLAVVGGAIQLSGSTNAAAGLRVQTASGVATLTGINSDNNAFNPIAFYAGATEAMRVNASGQAEFTAGTAALPAITTTGDTNTGIFYAASDTFCISTGGSERMRIDSAGSLLSGTSSAFGSGRVCIGFVPGVSTGIALQQSINTSSPTALNFLAAGGATIGSVTTTASATAYNTSSDYRLKNSVAPMTIGVATIAALKPVTYKWNVDDSSGEGFIAHELQDVIPQAVVGEKDAVNDDDSIKPQGVDYSKIVVHLVAAIQEQQAMITALTARITALEVTP